MRNILTFHIGQPREDKDILSVTPIIDGKMLSDSVHFYERSNEFDLAGSYGGLIPDFFDYGPLDRYFLGQAASTYWKNLGGIYVLGCQCGEVGCWPLVCKVSVTENDVTWSHFKQPFRRTRDYSRFGPFVFCKTDYEVTVRELSATIEHGVLSPNLDQGSALDPPKAGGPWNP